MPRMIVVAVTPGHWFPPRSCVIGSFHRLMVSTTTTSSARSLRLFAEQIREGVCAEQPPFMFAIVEPSYRIMLRITRPSWRNGAIIAAASSGSIKPVHFSNGSERSVIRPPCFHFGSFCSSDMTSRGSGSSSSRLRTGPSAGVTLGMLRPRRTAAGASASRRRGAALFCIDLYPSIEPMLKVRHRG